MLKTFALEMTGDMISSKHDLHSILLEHPVKSQMKYQYTILYIMCIVHN